MMDSSPPKLILASTSPYRRRLLERLQLPFSCLPPEVEETPLSDERPAALALRLASEKARAVSRSFPAALVIGSDQVAALDGDCLGKPGTTANACGQLRACSGRTVHFHTAVSLARGGQEVELACIDTQVSFRSLTDAQIADYVEREQPLNCAGSFRWEALGIALFTSLKSTDPTALEGLPLIETINMLQRQGISIFNTVS